MNPILSRRSLLLTAGAGALATAGCNGTANQKAAQQASASVASLGSATIGLTYIPNIQFAPFYWAADKGDFTRQGVTATLRHHGASEGLFTALTAGQEQYVLAGGDEVIQANSQGMDLVTVAGYYQIYPIVLIVPESSSITALADLRGKKIGVPGKYGETWCGLQLALKNASLTEADVQIVTIGYTQQAALATNKVDAIVGFSNNDAVQFKTNGVAVRTIPLGAEVPLVSSSIVTTRKQLSAHPELTRAVCKAIVAGVQGVVTQLDEAIETSVAHIPGLDQAKAQQGARATLEATLPLWRGSEVIPTLKLDAARFTQMERFMRNAVLISKDVDATQAVDATVLG